MKKFLLLSTTLLILISCSDDDINVGIEVPSNYEFLRDGATSVSYSGQTDRINMLSEIKTEVKKGDAGEIVSEQALLDMFANENNAFSDEDLNVSTKQLESKTFIADVSLYKELFATAATVSANFVENGTEASSGVAGRIQRGTSGSFILVNEKGQEFTQFIEKGLMGSVFFNQIFNVYLTDDRTGDDVDNTTIVEGANYTAMEHHWDEAFGYWGVPVDFPSELTSTDNRFWANYSYGREALLGTVTDLKNAYLRGRTAIVNNDFTTKNEQRTELYRLHEIVAASTAIHYINDTVEDLNGGDQGNALHHLSEAYVFVRAIKFSPNKALTDAQLEDILDSNFGADGDFWTVTMEGLQTAKETLVTTYPVLADVADQL